MLASNGFTVEAANGGASAIESVQESIAAGKPYDVAFVDWRMPGIDGVETIRRIRGLTAKPPAFVLVTAYGREEVLRLADQAGLSEVLVKPVNRSVLFDATMRALDEDRGPFEAPLDGTENRAKLRGLKILVAEDNEMNQEVARELLAAVGIAVDVVDDGAAALTRLQDASYDLVLMDLRMPVMDGIEATRAIRRDPLFANLPIIAMTANAMASDRQACLDAGMNDHIGKPVEPEELYAVLEHWAENIGKSTRTVDFERGPALPSDNAVTASPEDIALLQRLAPALDVRRGLDRVLNRTEVYFSLLRTLRCRPARTWCGSIREALAAGHRDDATLHAHTTNGSAGQIGADAVRSAAERLEGVLRAHGSNTDILAALTELEETLSTVIGAIDVVLPERRQNERPLKSDGNLTSEQLIALGEIVRLLEDDDPKARTLWHAHSDALVGIIPDGTHVLVTGAVDNFDFSVARDALSRTIELAKPHQTSGRHRGNGRSADRSHRRRHRRQSHRHERIAR